jgi:hypothetical protein
VPRPFSMATSRQIAQIVPQPRDPAPETPYFGAPRLCRVQHDGTFYRPLPPGVAERVLWEIDDLRFHEIPKNQRRAGQFAPPLRLSSDWPRQKPVQTGRGPLPVPRRA